MRIDDLCELVVKLFAYTCWKMGDLVMSLWCLVSLKIDLTSVRVQVTNPS
jgi:hypothetical protein